MCGDMRHIYIYIYIYSSIYLSMCTSHRIARCSSGSTRSSPTRPSGARLRCSSTSASRPSCWRGRSPRSRAGGACARCSPRRPSRGAWGRRGGRWRSLVRREDARSRDAQRPPAIEMQQAPALEPPPPAHSEPLGGGGARGGVGVRRARAVEVVVRFQQGWRRSVTTLRPSERRGHPPPRPPRTNERPRQPRPAAARRADEPPLDPRRALARARALDRRGVEGAHHRHGLARPRVRRRGLRRRAAHLRRRAAADAGAGRRAV